ncbi:MAG: hypothetical protein LAO21_20515 [Acidobacteriia bacterium]|nr:hypothetical protein [Terriglobia bacterium]
MKVTLSGYMPSSHGVVSLQAPVDRDFGERVGGVKDPLGNQWYIATGLGKSYILEGLHTVAPFLHPLRAEPVFNFLRRAFGAQEIVKHASPDGVVHHVKIRIGDSVLEMSEAHEPYQPMASTFYLTVPDVDVAYRNALAAGAEGMCLRTNKFVTTSGAAGMRSLHACVSERINSLLLRVPRACVLCMPAYQNE